MRHKETVYTDAETMPKAGDFSTSGYRVLQVKETDKGFLLKLRVGRDIVETELKVGMVFISGEKIGDAKLIKGNLYRYDYCRGSGYAGIALLRGIDGFEAWLSAVDVSRCKDIEVDADAAVDKTGGWWDNHFHHRNFIIPVTENFKLLSVEDDLAIGSY